MAALRCHQMTPRRGHRACRPGAEAGEQFGWSNVRSTGGHVPEQVTPPDNAVDYLHLVPANDRVRGMKAPANRAHHA
jgi:hypothetical protein